MSKQALFTMKLEPELHSAFMAEADAADRPASQIVRELMRDYIRKQQDARDYERFLRDKVQAARASLAAGRGVGDDEVRALMAEKRRRIAG